MFDANFARGTNIIPPFDTVYKNQIYIVGSINGSNIIGTNPAYLPAAAIISSILSFVTGTHIPVDFIMVMFSNPAVVVGL
jgi:hypothetical protein